MISDAFLRLLQCPETRTPLVNADEALVTRLRTRIREGSIHYADGSKPDKELADRLDGALVNEGRTLAYAVTDNIPNLIREEALPVEPAEG